MVRVLCIYTSQTRSNHFVVEFIHYHGTIVSILMPSILGAIFTYVQASGLCVSGSVRMNRIPYLYESLTKLKFSPTVNLSRYRSVIATFMVSMFATNLSYRQH